MKTIKLSALFNSKELGRILDFLNSNDWAGLRIFLNSKKEDLEKKGVLPDFIYYWLQSQFGK